VGAGDTLSAALAALLSVGAELHSAVSEALSFLDQSLDAGFRPGMGNVIPDRFFWALPAGDEQGAEPVFDEPAADEPPKSPRRMH
ncbi:bifunctional hydroxymethylpyrimidine kinase/phosphomethylpyrimidine kinase, partial [Klebsiella pneumoniae]|uniref:bifunctional hydroxymethylpyrimidine kinase/phosphomethylpyrimidine kinase n=3 Tax=Pseudomonadota TaxID=1224 RepID=UPI001954B817